MRTSRISYLALVGLLALRPAPGALAGEMSGNARVFMSRTDDEAQQEEDLMSSNLNLRYTQPLTPWVRLLISYQLTDMNATDSANVRSERRSSSPSVELTYNRPIFTARLDYQDRSLSGTTAADTLDVRSSDGFFSWRPPRGPQYSLRLARQSNVADVAVFGRDVDTRQGKFEISYPARTWSVHGILERFDLENATTGVSLKTTGEYLRTDYADSYLDNRISLSGELRVDRRRLDQTGGSLAEPIRPVQGLFALDTTPDTGALTPEPTLIDGDVTLPAGSPPIDIGGANTYRNVGLDLGLTLPMTRLEITVNALSDPGLIWLVYASPDNLVWQSIGGVASAFDSFFLRYTLRFPQTQTRYVKAVNVSANSQPTVAVTELRALLDVLQQAEHRTTTDQRGSLFALFRPSERVTGNLSVTYVEDSGSAEALALLGRRESYYDARLEVKLNPVLRSTVEYSFSDLTREKQPDLDRKNDRAQAALLWSPLPAVDGLLTASRFEEYGATGLVQRYDALEARAVTEILSDLRLTSQLIYSLSDQALLGYPLTSRTWKESVESRPTDTWSLGVGLALTWFQATGPIALSRRDSLTLQTGWFVTPFIQLSGAWDYGTEDGRWTLNQTYGLAWNPGRRLSVSSSFTESDSIGDVQTSSFATNLNYKTGPYLSVFSSYSRSAFRTGPVRTGPRSNLVAGFALSF